MEENKKKVWLSKVTLTLTGPVTILSKNWYMSISSCLTMNLLANTLNTN